MMIDQQSPGSASPTGLALHTSGEGNKMDVKITIWWDTQDRNNEGWACHLSRDEGYGFESDFSDPVDAEKDAPLQDVIDEALTGVRNVPAAALVARNWRSDQGGGYEFRGSVEA